MVMGVDFFFCHQCGESFPDCGDYVSCGDDCSNVWCSLDCACEEGYDDGYNEESEECEKTSCDFCRQEDAEDSELLEFLMKEHKLTRNKLLKMYFAKKTKKRKK
jgi:hypothetical protein